MTPLLVVLLAAQLFAQAGNPIVSPPVESHTTVTLQAPPPDPKAIAEASVESTQAIIIQVAAPIPVDWDNQMFNLPDLWRTTPDGLTWNNGPIRDIANFARAAALALLALAIFAVGAGYALGQGASLGRLIWAVILAIGELVWWEAGIRLNNAINNSIGAPDLPSLIRPHIALSADLGQQASAVVLVIVYAVVALLVMISMLFRLGLIQVLIAVGPLALICAATEQTEHFAHKYIAFSVGLLFSQVMIVIGMKVAQVDAALAGGVAGTIMALVVLLLLRRLPGLVSSTTSSGGNGIARLIGSVITRRVGRALS